MAFDEVTVPALPEAPRGDRKCWLASPDGGVSAVAGPATDLYIDPAGGDATLNAPRLLFTTPNDFQLSARVTVDFQATYDAGGLIVWVDEQCWAKLCFEYSPDDEHMIVSVVTRGVSDDANSIVVDGHATWLRISRLGPAYAFHASADGQRWALIRLFTLGAERQPAAAGFLAQSPTGGGCEITFDDVRFRAERLTNLRTGE
jgi:regulation of enolase protein 1 (concanavalin A-like superfamily)